MSADGVYQAVRGVILANLPEGFVEEHGHYKGMATWVVPKEHGIKTHDRRTAPIVALGERKSYVSLFLMGMYYDPGMSAWLDAAWAASGCPLKRGAASVQLRDLDDIPFDVVADAVSRLTVADVVAFFERWNARPRR